MKITPMKEGSYDFMIFGKYIDGYNFYEDYMNFESMFKVKVVSKCESADYHFLTFQDAKLSRTIGKESVSLT